MTKHDLKELAAMGAELGAAKAENEKLRGLLERIRITCCQVRDTQDLDTSPGLAAAEALQAQIDQLDAALSQQAEPVCDTCHGQGEVWTGDNQTFGYMSMQPPEPIMEVCPECGGEKEPAPAQDEQSPEQMLSREQIENIARKVHGECIRLPGATYQHAAEAAVMYTLERIARPTQTEQQGLRIVFDGPPGPEAGRFVEVEDTEGRSVNAGEWRERTDGLWELSLHATPHPEQSGKFAMYQRVRKTSGSEWQGRICGTYSTALTPEGYAVESEAHAGSVQIYPAKALEAVE